MIQLYTNNTLDTTKNGIILNPISCKITPKLNTSNECVLVHDLDKDGVYKYLEGEGLLKVPTPEYDDDQLYRIYDHEKDMENNTITVNARHVFFDLAKKTIFNKSVFGNGQQALEKIVEDTGFTAHSDITAGGSNQYKMRKVLNVIAGEDDDSFIKTYGGEIECNNFQLTINSRRGKDRGIKVTFGYNLKDIKEEINFDNVVTRIYPYSGDIVLDGNTPYVDSPIINKYSDVFEETMEMSDIKVKEKKEDADGNEIDDKDDKGFDTIEEARSEMKKRCLKLFEKGCDKIEANYKVDMVNLKKTTEYKLLGYDVLENVRLGDTLPCYNKNINIEVEARVVSYTYDCIAAEYDEIELGQFINGFVDQNSNKLENLYKKILLTEQNILLKVTALDNSTSSSIKLLKDSIKNTVEGLGASSSTEWKLGEITDTIIKDGVQETIKKSSDSIQVAWNNISNKAEINSEEGLCLGNVEEGTYSKIGYDGRLELMTKNAAKPYHCLVYVGSKTITTDSSEDYTECKESLPAMFNGIDDEDISISVSLKKLYDSNHTSGIYIPYWFGAYADIVDGEMVFKVMSAWRKIMYENMKVVTDVDVDFDSKDYSRDRDTIDYVETFGEAVNGRIDIQYTIIA